MVPILLALTLVSTDTIIRAPGDSVHRDSTAVAVPISLAPRINADTTPRRHRVVAVEYSDWYGRRLDIHRWASYAMLPMFVGQYFTGEELVRQGTAAPQAVKITHAALATGVAVLFTANTVTGLWNLWDGRKDPNGWKWRTAHSLMMLAADAGFTYVGSVGRQAKTSMDVRNRHKQVAIISGSVAIASWLMMLPPFRPD